MKTYARIEAGAVAELLATAQDIATLFHVGLLWVDVTGKSVAVGYLVHADGFAPPPAQAHAATVPTLADLQAEIARLAARLAALAPPAVAQHAAAERVPG